MDRSLTNKGPQEQTALAGALLPREAGSPDCGVSLEVLWRT